MHTFYFLSLFKRDNGFFPTRCVSGTGAHALELAGHIDGINSINLDLINLLDRALDVDLGGRRVATRKRYLRSFSKVLPFSDRTNALTIS